MKKRREGGFLDLKVSRRSKKATSGSNRCFGYSIDSLLLVRASCYAGKSRGFVSTNIAAQKNGGKKSHWFGCQRYIWNTGPEDVVFRVLYCGIDHTDLHQMRSEIHNTNYPLVPGHEFVVKVPEKLAPEQSAPLLCAGVTAYSPLRQFIGSDKVLKAGILGLGGVGHLGVLLAKAMGHHVTVISSSDKKREEALDHLGADAFLVSSNAAEMEGAANSLDYILDTVLAVHPLPSYLSLLKVEGKLVLVGAAPKPLQFDAVDMILGKKTITGSFIGSMEETQEIFRVLGRKGFDINDRSSEDGLCEQGI
ncbi:hypothetical protein F0562_006633 [Nyssa sinensis]|uniref:Alcohol dehydrogenase-like C-terminal domain-containing protein n=1 Tax=Nyssa sinensis TaxID=561372 RepID=A0A5J5ALP0_9ASTE|nr:hypothetical protein F0562_006633 [Nyssa sinensis]